MHIPRPLLFVAQATTLGLALAFLVTLMWPSLIPRPESPTVEVREAAPVSGTPASGPYSYANAVERAAPAVVKIDTAKVVTVRAHPVFDDPLFQQFFGDAELGQPRKQLQTGLGSGVIFSEQGYILTNHHVVRGADAIRVFLRDGRSTGAKVIGSDPETDVAVLKIDLPNLPVITLGHSERVRVGDVVLAIGNPFGVGQTVTQGIVSGTGRNQLGINTFENFIQTDAAINPGNSGGALVDANGNLIGINTAIFSKSGGSEGIGFAIPIGLARGVMEQIIEHGRPLRGWLGAEAQSLTPALAQAVKLPRDTEGLIITNLFRNGPAHRAGLKPGDVILAMDGKKISDARQMLAAISSHKPGETIQVDIARNGATQRIAVVAGERPQERPER